MIGTTHRATIELGDSVVGGELLWESASGITTADTNSDGGCLRKWWFEKVDRRKPPSTKSQDAGTRLHAEIEGHLVGGEQLVSPLALAGRKFIPEPGPYIHVEQSILGLLKVGSVRIAGHTDLFNLRDEWIDETGELRDDQRGTLGVWDWKTTSDFKWAKTPAMLKKNVQLNLYAAAGFAKWPERERARLTHVYFRTKDRPAAQLATVLRERKEVDASWEYAKSIVRSLIDVAAEENPDRVPANLRACASYGGCPHKKSGVCTEHRKTSLDQMFNKLSKDFRKDSQMGFLSSLAPPQPDMKAQVEEEEKQLRKQQSALQNPVPPWFPAAWKRIEAAKRGAPTLGGKAAVAYGNAKGYSTTPGNGFAGAGDFAKIHITELADVLVFANELAQEAGEDLIDENAAPTHDLLPPDAGVSTPATASAKPKEATEPAPEGKKRGPGRPPGAKNKEGAATPMQTASPVPSPSSAGESQVAQPPAAPTLAAPTTSAFEVCVDCIPNGTFQSLNGYVAELNRQLAERYCVDDRGKPTVQDIRCAPKDSPLGFGGWKGGLYAVVRDNPPSDGVWVLDTRGNEMAEIVADALREVCDRVGGRYTRGVR